MSVSTGTACSWTASNSASWVTITSGPGGTGNGTVHFSVAANTTGAARSASLTVGGQSVLLSQDGVSPEATSLFVPIALSAAGLNNSFFTSEMTLTNPQSKQTVKLATQDSSEDTWAQVKGKWMRKQTRVLKENSTMNGKPLPGS